MYNILIVDDEVPIREWLAFCLKKASQITSIQMASNGTDGYKMFCEKQADIVFADINMPRENGLEMIEKIRAIAPSVYCVFLTNHSSFDYARKAIQLNAEEYVLKTEITETKLLNILETAKNKLQSTILLQKASSDHQAEVRDNFLCSLVENPLLRLTEEMLERFSLPVSNLPTIVFGCQFTQYAGQTAQMEHLLKTNTPSFTDVTSFRFNRSIAFVFGSLKLSSLSPDKIMNSVGLETAMRLSEVLHCKVGISPITFNPVSLNSVLRTAKENLAQSFYEPNKTIFFQETRFTKVSNSKEIYNALERALVNQDYNEIKGIKDSTVAKIQQEKPTDINATKALFVHLLTRIIHLVEEDLQVIELVCQDVEKKINVAVSFDEVVEEVDRVFGMFHIIFESNKAQYSKNISRAMDYIQKKYMHPITLIEVANAASITPEYLSKLFKKELGLNYVVYLNNIRLKQAKFLLETTNKRIYEIAEEVGYSNISYFSTVFKKNFGMNPFEYR